MMRTIPMTAKETANEDQSPCLLRLHGLLLLRGAYENRPPRENADAGLPVLHGLKAAETVQEPGRNHTGTGLVPQA